MPSATPSKALSSMLLSAPGFIPSQNGRIHVRGSHGQIQYVVDGVPIGGLGAYEAEWHTDMSYNEMTPSASILYAIEIPPSGGDTWFCDMYDAYDQLPPDLKSRIAGLKCVHDASRTHLMVVEDGEEGEAETGAQAHGSF